MALERTMVVATLFKLYRIDGKFVKADMKAVKKEKVVPMATVEKYNSQWKSCGKFYEVNEKKTEEYFAKSGERNIELAEAEKAKNQLTNTLSNLAKGKITNNDEVPVIDIKAQQEAADAEADRISKELETADAEKSKAEIKDLNAKHEDALTKVIESESALESIIAELKENPEDAKLIEKHEKAAIELAGFRENATKAEGVLDYAKDGVKESGWFGKFIKNLGK